MAVALRYGLPAGFLPGERTVLWQRMGFMTFKSALTYKWVFPIPLVCRGTFHITDRRLAVRIYVIPGIVWDFATWFPGRGPKGDGEMIKSVRVASSRVAGKCLEVVSENTGRRGWLGWAMGREMRMRFYAGNAEELSGVMNALADRVADGEMEQAGEKEEGDKR